MNHQNALTIKLNSILSDLKRLDYNGYNDLTDGSLQDYSTAEQIKIAREAIEWIRNENENIDDDYRQNFRKS
jgi:hypothetical protein